MLAWLGDVLQDPDPGLRYWGIDVLRYLGYGEMTGPKLVEPHVARAQAIADALPTGDERDHVAEKVADIRAGFEEQAQALEAREGRWGSGS